MQARRAVHSEGAFLSLNGVGIVTRQEPCNHIEAIRTLKARYFRGMDTKDEALFRSVFAPDIRLDARGSTTDPTTGFNPFDGVTGGVIEGVDNLVSQVFANLPDMSVHQGYMPEIEIVDEDQATGIWAMSDLLRWRAGPLVEMRGNGHYHETYRRIDGVWKIGTSRLTRLYLDVVPRTPIP